MPTTDNKLTRNELIDLLNEDAVARAEARTLANISRRAQTLFTDGGYSVRATGHGGYCVFSPEGKTYAVCISDTPDHELFGSYCTCPCFETRQTCKHLQGVLLAIEEGAEGDMQCQRDGFDPYALRH